MAFRKSPVASTGTCYYASKITQVPLFFQYNISEHTRLAVWKIEEQEEFFTASVSNVRTISHPHKRLQHLAGRYLLRHRFPDFPSGLIRIADTRKPFLAGQAYRFSISHAEDYAAAIVSTTHHTGIDVEVASQKIHAVRHKFLSDHDAGILFNNEENPTDLQGNMLTLTLAWSAKEAIYKWYGKGELDFKKDMILNSHCSHDQSGTLMCTFSKAAPREVCIHYRVFGRLVLTWLVEPE